MTDSHKDRFWDKSLVQVKNIRIEQKKQNVQILANDADRQQLTTKYERHHQLERKQCIQSTVRTNKFAGDLSRTKGYTSVNTKENITESVLGRESVCKRD
jgi:hypothetical protein